MTLRLIIARPLPGTVGETRRVAHAFPHELGQEISERMTAYCGAAFDRKTLELLAKPSGMPCEACLRHVPRPANELPASADADTAATSSDRDRLAPPPTRMARQVTALTDSADDAEAMNEVIRMQHQLGQIRKSRGWSLASVARQLNVHDAVLWKWENDPACTRSLQHLQMYARFLGYTVRVVLIENDADANTVVDPGRDSTRHPQMLVSPKT